MSKEITKELLEERFIINPKTGIILNRISSGPRAQAGKEAGSLGQRGYRSIKINGRDYKTARIIWFYAHGCWPINIDHINHVKTDDRLINLRSVSQAENCRNRSKNSNNTSGVAGVYWDKKARKWCARIKVDGQRIHLGYFNNLADAATTRAAAKIEHGYHANHA